MTHIATDLIPDQLPIERDALRIVRGGADVGGDLCTHKSVDDIHITGAAATIVAQAPWRPFPRNILSGKATLLPRPPRFVTNRRQHVLGRLLARFQHSPGWLKLPRIFVNALRA